MRQTMHSKEKEMKDKVTQMRAKMQSEIKERKAIEADIKKRHIDGMDIRQREIYAKSKEIGEDSADAIVTVNNLADSLMATGLFAEARTLVREHLTEASDSIGADHQETLYLRMNYAVSLTYEDADHNEESDDEQDRKDYLEAERVAADVLRRAERIFGSHHPVTDDARAILEDVRKEIAGHERRATLRRRPKRARTSCPPRTNHY